MLNTNHPDDERLSALAARDLDKDDAALAAHVAACDRCASVVSELAALRVALSELPDLTPSRPLQLIPAVERARADEDRAGGWARRLFTPLLAGGAALALVGAVGTATPALDGATGGADSAASEISRGENDFAGAGGRASAGGAPAAEGVRDEFGALGSDGESAESAEAEPRAAAAPTDAVAPGAVTDSASRLESSASAERSPWPMVLFAGVAVMIAALLMRWVLVPRAG